MVSVDIPNEFLASSNHKSEYGGVPPDRFAIKPPLFAPQLARIVSTLFVYAAPSPIN